MIFILTGLRGLCALHSPVQNSFIRFVTSRTTYYTFIIDIIIKKMNAPASVYDDNNASFHHFIATLGKCLTRRKNGLMSRNRANAKFAGLPLKIIETRIFSAIYATEYAEHRRLYRYRTEIFKISNAERHLFVYRTRLSFTYCWIYELSQCPIKAAWYNCATAGIMLRRCAVPYCRRATT